AGAALTLALLAGWLRVLATGGWMRATTLRVRHVPKFDQIDPGASGAPHHSTLRPPPTAVSAAGRRRAVPARVPENANDLYVAAVGRTGGASGTYWRSDVTLFNPGSASVSATVRFLRAGEDNRFAGGRTISVGANGTRTLRDVMSWVGAGEGTGALQITWSGHSEGIVVTSRTYTTRAADSGTLGQSIGMTASGEFGRKGIVTGLSSDNRFRANVGLLNSGDSPINITLRLIAPDGRQLGSTAVTVGAKSQMQWSAASLFSGISFASLGNFTIVAESSGPTMFAYGSVIDNESGDPIFVSGK
ncbi:MAG: hypothetical protein KY432_02510, partial [Acidobacteria bacterium]|nr:hypothetical protein [Acidobacteriota bacterium]